MFTLERSIRKVFPVFSSPKGHREILRGILRTEHPFRFSEYVFKVQDEDIIPQVIGESQGTKAVLAYLENFSPEAFTQMLTFQNTARIPDARDGLYFHVHPNVGADLRGYSSEDKEFARHAPLGLIEYDISGSVITGEAFLRYGRREKFFFDIEFILNDDGTYLADDILTTSQGTVPLIGAARAPLVDAAIETFSGTKKYVFQHCVKRT